MKETINSSINAFESARFKSLLFDLKHILVGRNNELLSFEKIKKDFSLYKQKYLGVRAVDIEKIVGSLDRYNDFDSNFLPKKAHLQHRWAKIHNLIARDEILPPVKLYKVGDMYFVVDGHHRVSASAKIGVKFIDADVTEFITDVPLTTDSSPEELFLYAERENFLNLTGLKKSRPQISTRVTVIGQYDFLLGQINKTMVQLNENKKTSEKLTSFEDAAVFWYDNIYVPAIETIISYGIIEKFPNRTKTDLYIWINEHKRYLSLKFGKEVIIKFAAKDFLARFSRSPLRRFKLKLIRIKYRLLKKFIRGYRGKPLNFKDSR